MIVQKRSNDIPQVVSLKSEGGRYNTLFLSNYASLNIVDELKRVKGVGDVTIFGAQDYSMRVWLKPDRMAQLGLTTEVANAIQRPERPERRRQDRPGTGPNDQQLVYTVTAKGPPADAGGVRQHRHPRQRPGGACCASRTSPASNWAPTATIRCNARRQSDHRHRVFLQTGANALDVADAVRQDAELKAKFPEGMDYVIPFDTTRFVRRRSTKC